MIQIPIPYFFTDGISLGIASRSWVVFYFLDCNEFESPLAKSASQQSRSVSSNVIATASIVFFASLTNYLALKNPEVKQHGQTDNGLKSCAHNLELTYYYEFCRPVRRAVEIFANLFVLAVKKGSVPKKLPHTSQTPSKLGELGELGELGRTR